MEVSKDQIASVWDLNDVRIKLQEAYETNSETKLLSVLKDNSFLFYELYSRKGGIQPVFKELNFGTELRCDFAWLNDNSDGPEWVLVEVEKPLQKLFTSSNDPSSQLNHAINQVTSWRRYFDNHPDEKRRIFGAVSRFRFILVIGSLQEWHLSLPSKWRRDFNKENEIEIHSSDVFIRPLEILEKHPESLWSFAEHPIALSHSQLQRYWQEYDYMTTWRGYIN